ARTCWPRPAWTRLASAPPSWPAGRTCSIPRRGRGRQPGAEHPAGGVKPGSPAHRIIGHRYCSSRHRGGCLLEAIRSAAQNGASSAPAGKDAPPARMSRRVYRFRILGMVLGAVCIGAVLYENQASLATWALCVVMGLVWPHLAFALARCSANPNRTEIRNLLA